MYRLFGVVSAATPILSCTIDHLPFASLWIFTFSISVGMYYRPNSLHATADCLKPRSKARSLEKTSFVNLHKNLIVC